MTDTYPGLPLPRRWWAIVAISFGTALLVLDGAIANVALPTIARDLGVTNAVITNVVTVYQLVLVMFLLPFSSLGDRLGHRRLYQYGQGLFMLSSALCLVANSFWLLLLLRVLQALGSAMALSVSSAMLRQIYPASKLGTGLGLNSVIVASSAALAPTLGGYIVSHADWQWVFVAAAPLAIVSLLLGQSLPDPAPQDRKTDWVGSIWSALTMLLIVGGLQLGTHGTVVLGAVIGVLGAVSLVKLVQRERQMSAPVLPVDLLSKPAIGLSALAGMASFIAAGTLMLSLPFRLQEDMGFDPQHVGMLLLPFPLTMLVVSPFSGWLSDRIAATKLGVAGMIVAICGLLLIAFMPERPSDWDIAARLAFTALGFGLFFAPNTRLLISRAPRDRAAAAGGLLAGGLGMGPVPMLLACGLAVLAAACSVTRYRFREPSA
jgi:DHA2 family multidrug resistance protein-like MFS transporter